MVITDRDRQVLDFLATWRFGTLEQFQRALIFNNATNTAYKRLLALRKAGLIKAGQLPSGLYYYLTPAGGEVVGLADPWYSRRYKDARSNMVVKELTFIDFALAMGIKYLDRKEILERWKRASYETLARIFKAKDRYFFLDGCLQVLILDYYHSTKYLLEKVTAYARLPPELRKEVIINVLVFSETKKAQLARATVTPKGLGYKFFLVDDYPVVEITNLWEDTAGRVIDMVYAVQTNHKLIERCILMTTDPGDLVFDPTCGSGTTAYCAEKWGRRWITCDTSRVALAIARQRLMTATFDYYELADPEGKDISKGFIYETVPHITLESIAHNTRIDAVAAKYQPEIDRLIKSLSDMVGKELKEWEIPIEFPGDWPEKAKTIHEEFLALKHKKRQEIDAVIKQDAPRETLYDKPRVDRKKVRVSGPFTVEAIPVPVVEDPSISQTEQVAEKAGDYIANMIELLRKDCLTFPGGKKMVIQHLRPLNLGALHAEGEVGQNGKTLRAAISFGPQFGPVTATQVAEALPIARANGYDLLIFAGFAFDSEAQAFVQKVPVTGLQIHFANIAQDVLVGDLLKTKIINPIGH